MARERRCGGALVTGAGARIGRATALALAEVGYDVAVHFHSDRSSDDAQATVAAVREHGRRAGAVQADLSDVSALPGLVQAAREAAGPLALLVNNASRFEDDRFGALEPDDWEAHMAANLRAPVFLAQAFAAALPDAAEDGEAAVVNILDQRVLHPDPLFFSYALAKSGLFTATRMMAQALAPRVRVNAVAPGPVLASVHQDKDAFAREVAATPLERAVKPEEIAEAVVWLARARAVTGQTLAVDSGQHLAWKTPDVAEA